jgi:hypothetical protein
MAKIITRSEVNDIREGTYSSDLNKAVLHGDVEISSGFKVESVNSVTHLDYTSNQALLETDIELASDIQVTLTPRQAVINPTAQTAYFDITTAGTPSVGAPVYSVVTATYNGGAPESVSLNGTVLTITFRKNTMSTEKPIVAQVKLTVDGNEFLSNVATASHGPAVSFIFYHRQYATKLPSSGGSTNDFYFDIRNARVTGFTCNTGCTVVSGGTETQPTLTFIYPENTGSQERGFLIRMWGIDNYGVERYVDENQLRQYPGAYTFVIDGPDEVAATSSSSTLTITSQNVDNIGWDQSQSRGIFTCNINDNNVTVTYPRNIDDTPVDYVLCLTGQTPEGKVVSETAEFVQEGLGAYIQITFPTANVSGESTTNSFIFTPHNVDAASVGYYAAGSSNISSCTGISSYSYTGMTTFTQNPSYTDQRIMTLALTGTSIVGTVITGTATFTQSALGDNYTFNIRPHQNPVPSTGTTNNMPIEAVNVTNVGYNAAASSGLTSLNVISNTHAIAQFTKNTGAQSLKMVSITGTTGGGTVVSATTTFTQSAAVGTGFTFEYTGSTLNPASGSTSDFKLSLLNASLTSVVVPEGCSYTTGGTIISPTLSFTYPGNADGAVRTYAVTVTVTDVYDRQATKSVNVSQRNSASSFAFQSDFNVSGNVTSTTISFDYAYLSTASISLTAVGGAFFNPRLTQPSTSFSVASGAVSAGTVTIYFDRNTGSGARVFTITSSGVYGQAGETLSDSINVTQTNIPSYNVTFVPNTPMTIYWEDEYGRSGESAVTSSWVQSGILNGSSVSYSGTSNGYISLSGSTVVNGNTSISVDLAPNCIFKMGPENPDGHENVFRIDYSTSNGASGSFSMSCSGLDDAEHEIVMPNGYFTDEMDTITYHISGITISGDIDVNSSVWSIDAQPDVHLQNLNFNEVNEYLESDFDVLGENAREITVHYIGNYPAQTGTIYANTNGTAVSAFTNFTILLDNNSGGVTFTGNGSRAFSYKSSGNYACKIGGAITSGDKYLNHTLKIVSSGSTVLYNGPCSGLVSSSISLSNTQINGSTWYLTYSPQVATLNYTPDLFSGTNSGEDCNISDIDLFFMDNTSAGPIATFEKLYAGEVSSGDEFSFQSQGNETQSNLTGGTITPLMQVSISFASNNGYAIPGSVEFEYSNIDTQEKVRINLTKSGNTFSANDISIGSVRPGETKTCPGEVKFYIYS